MHNFQSKMDVVFETVNCLESNRKIIIVKLPDGSSEKFFFNVTKRAFEKIVCVDGKPVQMDSDLTPHHSVWCPHIHKNIIFAYNHLLRMNLQYLFDSETLSFHETKCDQCHLDPKKSTNVKQILLVAASPKIRRPIVLTMSQEGRVLKMCYDEIEKNYVDMSPTEIKALTQLKDG